MYHPRKSKNLPSRYSFVWHDEHLYGVNHAIDDFPSGLSKAVERQSRSFFGSPRVSDALIQAERSGPFPRPEDHRRLLESLSFDWIKVATTSQEIADKITEMAKKDFHDLFPKLNDDIRGFLVERDLMKGEVRALYEHRLFSLSLMLCVVAS